MTNHSYREVKRVTGEYNGLPINLILREVINDGPRPYHSVGWRTVLRESRKNRRGYYVSDAGGYWRLPVDIALLVLELGEAEGLLSPVYDDAYLRLRHAFRAPNEGEVVYHSRELTAENYRILLAEITNHDEELGLGPRPSFVIVEQPGGLWRKIMLVDSGRQICTFRSTTTIGSYGMKQARGMIPPWFLDRSMMEASTATMRVFLEELRRLRNST